MLIVSTFWRGGLAYVPEHWHTHLQDLLLLYLYVFRQGYKSVNVSEIYPLQFCTLFEGVCLAQLISSHIAAILHSIRYTDV